MKEIFKWVKKFFKWHEQRCWSFMDMFRLDWYKMWWVAFAEGVLFTLFWVWLLG